VAIREVEVKGKKYKITNLKKVGDKIYVTVGDKPFEIYLGDVDFKSPYQPSIPIKINDKTRKLQLIKMDQEGLVLKLDGKVYEPKFLETSTSGILRPLTRKTPYESIKPMVSYKRPIEKGGITAPMSGRVVAIKKHVGDSVKEGDVICILEAMKMENEIIAPKSGTIKKITIEEGTGVSGGEVLFVID